MSEKTNKEMQQEMELQLHEQYAINNNANLSSVITLLAALFAVFCAYGWVYVNKVCLLAHVFAAVCFVLSLMYCICLCVGVGQRRDQFIIDAIRKKYNSDKIKKCRSKDGVIYASLENGLFPMGYTPFAKTTWNTIPGVFGVVTKAIVAAFVLLSIVTALKILNASMSEKIIACVSFAITLCVCLAYSFRMMKKYKSIQQYYLNEQKNLIHNVMAKNERKVLRIVQSEQIHKIDDQQATFSVDDLTGLEDVVIMNSKDYEAIYGVKKKEQDENAQRLAVVKLTCVKDGGKRTIWRQFIAMSGMTQEYLGLNVRSRYMLGIEDNSEVVEVSKGCKFMFYWNHPVHATRISTRLGVWSIGLAVVAMAMSVYFWIWPL